MKQERIAWLDDAKGLGICLIMLAHVSQYFPMMGGIHAYVCSFHVAIFFLVSGCLAEIKSGDDRKVPINIRKRIPQLLIPYVVFSVINSAVKFLVLAIRHSVTREIVKKELVELFITGNGTVWFLLCLFFTEILFALLQKIRLAEAGVLLIICVYLLPTPVNPFLIVVLRIIAGTGFYCAGYLFARLYRKRKVPFVLTVILLAVGMIVEVRYGCRTDFFNAVFKKTATSIICGIVSSIGYMLLLEKWEETEGSLRMKKFFHYFGENSMTVMLVHPILLQVIMYPFGEWFVGLTGWFSVFLCMAVYILLVAAELPFIWIINKYFPFLAGRKWGSDGKNNV